MKDTATLFHLSYGYTQNGGNNGQLTSITDNAEPGRTVNYTYDGLARLKTAVTNGSAAYPQWGLSWTYDRYGNRLAQNVTAGSAPSVQVTVDATKNRVTTTGFTYDNSGNVTDTGPSPTFSYNLENFMSAAGTSSYQYDAQGRRVRKTAESTIPSTPRPTTCTRSGRRGGSSPGASLFVCTPTCCFTPPSSAPASRPVRTSAWCSTRLWSKKP